MIMIIKIRDFVQITVSGLLWSLVHRRPDTLRKTLTKSDTLLLSLSTVNSMKTKNKYDWMSGLDKYAQAISIHPCRRSTIDRVNHSPNTMFSYSPTKIHCPWWHDRLLSHCHLLNQSINACLRLSNWRTIHFVIYFDMVIKTCTYYIRYTSRNGWWLLLTENLFALDLK